MISKIRSKISTRRITRELVDLYTDFTWVDEPVFWRNKTSQTDGKLWHKWGRVGDADTLTEFLKTRVAHKNEEEFVQGIHELARKMIRAGYLEHTPGKPNGFHFQGKINDIGRIDIEQRPNYIISGEGLYLAQEAFHIRSEKMYWINLARDNIAWIFVIAMSFIQLMETLSNIGVLDWVNQLLIE